MTVPRSNPGPRHRVLSNVGRARVRIVAALSIACMGVALAASPQDADGDDEGSKDGAGGGAWDIVEPAPAVALTPAVLEELDGFECTGCHAEVVDEWAASAHGLAWVDTEYQEALEDRRRPQQCWSCHIPEDMHTTDGIVAKVVEREDERGWGISCNSCHRGHDGAMLGPRGTPTEGHASRASTSFVGTGSDALCMPCHSRNIGPVVGIAKDYEKAYKSERGHTCVGCHMAPVDRRWANAPEGEERPVRNGRSHALQTPRDPGFLRRSFELAAHPDGNGVKLVVGNLAGHRVPGLIGRTMEFRAVVKDAQGKTVARAKLKIDKRNFLPVDGARELAFEEAGTEIHVVGRYEDLRTDDPIEFLDQVVPVTE